MELFQEDGSFMTEVSLLEGGRRNQPGTTSWEEELLDEATPPEELVGGGLCWGVKAYLLQYGKGAIAPSFLSLSGLSVQKF